MSNGDRPPLPGPPIFPDPGLPPPPGFPGEPPDPFPFPSPDIPPFNEPRAPILPALPFPQGPFPSRPPFGTPGDVRSLPLPGANEPFGGRVIRIGRILRGVGLGSIIIIAAEILVDVIRRKQLQKMEQILTDQDLDIAQAQLDRRDKKLRELDAIVLPGRLDLPRIGDPIFSPPAAPTAPQISPEIAPAAPPILPELFPEIPDLPAPAPAPQRRPAIDPGPLTSPGQIPRAPVVLPGSRPVFFPVGLPVQFPILDPVGFPILDPIGDLLPKPLTPIGTSPLPFGEISFAPQPFPQPQQDTAERCQTVKRRRRRKGKCREGFFIERPGGTDFITWREQECDSGDTVSVVQEIGGAVLEVVK